MALSTSYYYDLGTVSVEAGATAVTGGGTSWSGLVQPGDVLALAGLMVIISDVVDATHITLLKPWPGATQSGAGYAISFGSPARYDGVEVPTAIRDLISATRAVASRVETYEVVSAMLDAPPVSPVTDDIYLVGLAPTGAWTGRAGHLAQWTGTGWSYIEPRQGLYAYALDTDMLWQRSAAGWAIGVQADRNALNGRTPTLVADFVRDACRLNGSGISAGELFARAGVAKRVIGASGLVEVVSDNILAFDYSSGRRRMVAEGAATNYIRYAHDFAGTGWFSDGGSTITPNAAVAPDGTMTADRCQIASYLSCTPNTNITSRATFSVWLRSATGVNQTVQMYLICSTPDGIVVSQNFTITTTWQRFVLTGTPLPGATGFWPNIASGDVYAWGAQFEVGHAATSLISTAGSAVTRPADVVAWSDKAVGAVNTTGCTLAFRGWHEGLTSGYSTVVHFGSSSFYFEYASGYYTFSPPGTTGIYLARIVSEGALTACMSWGSSGSAASIGGGSAGSNATPASGAISAMYFGNLFGVEQILAIDEVAVWSIAGSAAAVTLMDRPWE